MLESSWRLQCWESPDALDCWDVLGFTIFYCVPQPPVLGVSPANILTLLGWSFTYISTLPLNWWLGFQSPWKFLSFSFCRCWQSSGRGWRRARPPQQPGGRGEVRTRCWSGRRRSLVPGWRGPVWPGSGRGGRGGGGGPLRTLQVTLLCWCWEYYLVQTVTFLCQTSVICQISLLRGLRLLTSENHRHNANDFSSDPQARGRQSSCLSSRRHILICFVSKHY